MKRSIPSLLFLLLALFLGACASPNQNNSIVPVSMRDRIESIYVEANPKVDIPALLPDMLRSLSAMGFVVFIVDPGTAPEGVPVLSYEVRIGGGTNVQTITFLKVELRRNGRLLGCGVFDSSSGINQFGSTAEKLEPLLRGMFEYVRPKKNTVR